MLQSKYSFTGHFLNKLAIILLKVPVYHVNLTILCNNFKFKNLVLKSKFNSYHYIGKWWGRVSYSQGFCIGLHALQILSTKLLLWTPNNQIKKVICSLKFWILYHALKFPYSEFCIMHCYSLFLSFLYCINIHFFWILYHALFFTIILNFVSCIIIHNYSEFCIMHYYSLILKSVSCIVIHLFYILHHALIFTYSEFCIMYFYLFILSFVYCINIFFIVFLNLQVMICLWSLRTIFSLYLTSVFLVGVLT